MKRMSTRKSAKAASALGLARPVLAVIGGLLERIGRRLFASWRKREQARQLRLCETVSLGEKRFVALIEVGPQRFLIGGTPQALTVLGKLRPAPSAFEEWLGASERQHRMM